MIKKRWSFPPFLFFMKYLLLMNFLLKIFALNENFIYFCDTKTSLYNNNLRKNLCKND